MKKKVIILQHNGGRLANQLWLFVSVYAYCLEMGYACRNYSFFEYAKYFNISSGNRFFDLFAKLYGVFEPKNYFLKKIYRKIARITYSFFVKIIEFFNRKNVVYGTAQEDAVTHRLPPSENVDVNIESFDSDPNREKIYLDGWLFRNPRGLEKFRDKIRTYFELKERYFQDGRKQVEELREKYKIIVGVHIRKRDYRSYRNGVLFFTEKEVADILRDFVEHMVPERACFVLFSDEKINTEYFSGLPVFYSDNRTDVGDLFQLSSMDMIIGSDSTFGGIASYFGNAPFVIFQKDGVDWEYYKGKKKYFENEYSIVNKY